MIDLTEAFTKEGIKKLKVGQLLRFNFEGSMNEYIVTSLNKKTGKVFGKSVTTYHPDEATIKDKLGDEQSFTTWKEEKESE